MISPFSLLNPFEMAWGLDFVSVHLRNRRDDLGNSLMISGVPSVDPPSTTPYSRCGIVLYYNAFQGVCDKVALIVAWSDNRDRGKFPCPLAWNRQLRRPNRARAILAENAEFHSMKLQGKIMEATNVV